MKSFIITFLTLASIGSSYASDNSDFQLKAERVNNIIEFLTKKCVHKKTKKQLLSDSAICKQYRSEIDDVLKPLSKIVGPDEEFEATPVEEYEATPVEEYEASGPDNQLNL